MIVKYEFTLNEKSPAVITFDKFSSPVWIQQKWFDGQYARFIRKNGCGHCCTAMALNLNGIKIDPHEEFSLCRELWGEPNSAFSSDEDNFMSVSGIVKIFCHFGIHAEYFGVPKGKCNIASEHIAKSLSNAKSVILWSHPSQKLDPNPFSAGEHYIYLVGQSDNGKLLVANSSLNSDAKNGIQFTDIETISKVLMEGCMPMDYTWGRYDLEHSGGYVVVG